MIKTFADRHTKEVYETGKSKRLPPEIWKRALRKLEYLDLATGLDDLKVPPTHPGEMLKEDFMPDYGLSVSSMSKALGVSRQTVNELLRERRAVSPEMALRLSRLFGDTPEVWVNAQRAVGLWETARAVKKKIDRINALT